MSLKLYNSLTRQLEEFAPIDKGNVRMYVCGPTVYDRAHIGNARPVVVFDVLFRMLRAKYGENHVTYVRNITDVEDKIIAAAAARGEAIGALTRRYTDFYQADMAALGCLPPTVEPRATEHIEDMIEMIETLIAKGNAYEAEGHVLFAVAESPDYGKLSGRNRDEQIAGARVDVAPYKRDPADFVLWKPSPPDYPGWDSPWGRGRPGWHIECSAMATKHLGERFDIHGGGIDLIFPHHENEIAQSRCAHGDDGPANIWMHNGHVVVGGQKMSKSLGNFVTVEDLLKKWQGEVIRLALLSAHYTQPLDITEDLLTSCKARLDQLYGKLRRKGWAEDAKVYPELETALNNNLNVIGALSELQKIADDAERDFNQASSFLRASGAVLGLLQQDPEEWFHWQPVDSATLDKTEIESLIIQRKEARARRDFAEADRIRRELKERNIELEDSGNDTIWRFDSGKN